MAHGTDEGGAQAAKMDERIAWESEEVKEHGGDGKIVLLFPPLFCKGYSCPRDLRTAHCGGRRISFV